MFFLYRFHFNKFIHPEDVSVMFVRNVETFNHYAMQKHKEDQRFKRRWWLFELQMLHFSKICKLYFFAVQCATWHFVSSWLIVNWNLLRTQYNQNEHVIIVITYIYVFLSYWFRWLYLYIALVLIFFFLLFIISFYIFGVCNLCILFTDDVHIVDRNV